MVLKKICPIFILVFLSFNSFSQIIVAINQLKLTEGFAEIFESPIGFEIGYFNKYVDNRYQLSASIGYYRSQPTADEFIGYGLLSDGNGTSLLRTKNVYKDFVLIPIRIGGTFNLLDKPFSPFVALGAIVYTGTFDLESEGGLINSMGNVLFQGSGLYPEFGVFYTIQNTIQIRLGLGKLLSIPVESEKMQYWKMGLTALIQI